jgi:hypothetical protein
MDNKEVKRLVELRGYVISFYNSIENPGASASMMKSSDVAYTCESIVRSMDDILKKYVSFANNESQ